MKKLFIAFYLIIIFCIPTFAEYKPIPANLSKQYKKEMEHIIDVEYPNTIKNADNYLKEAKTLRNKILKHGFNTDEYMNIVLISEICIPASAIDLYANLLEVTQEKYLGMKYEPIGTDCINPIYDILSPYFDDNNIDKTKLTKIARYEEVQIKIIEKYLIQINSHLGKIN